MHTHFSRGWPFCWPPSVLGEVGRDGDTLSRVAREHGNTGSVRGRHGISTTPPGYRSIPHTGVLKGNGRKRTRFMQHIFFQRLQSPVLSIGILISTRKCLRASEGGVNP